MKIIRLSPIFFYIILIMPLLSGCILNSPITSPSPAVVVVPTGTPAAVPPTPVPLPTETLVPSPTPTPEPVKISAKVNVDVINLREGPGTVFRVRYRVLKDTSLALLGKDQGGNWVLVKMPEGYFGWAAVTFLSVEGDILALPTLPISDAFLIKGRVLDSDGFPIEGINVAIYKQVGGEERRTDSTSLENGEFSAFLPLTEDGTWNVEVVGIGCTSRIVDADCKYGGRFEPKFTQISLPDESYIEFKYFQN